MSDGTVNAKLPDPAVTEVLLKKLALKAAGKLRMTLRANTAPSGYKIHKWISGTVLQYKLPDTNIKIYTQR